MLKELALGRHSRRTNITCPTRQELDRSGLWLYHLDISLGELLRIVRRREVVINVGLCLALGGFLLDKLVGHFPLAGEFVTGALARLRHLIHLAPPLLFLHLDHVLLV